MIRKVLPYSLLLVVLSTTLFAQPELDTTFAGIGKGTINFGATASTDDMAIQIDNKIVLVSSCFNINLSSFAFCAVRLHPDGSMDNTFRTFAPFAGVYAAFGTDVEGVAVQNDGKVVAVGYRTVSGDFKDVAIVRWTATGALDPTFGNNGTLATDFVPSGNDRAKKVIIQPDGKILIVGTAHEALFVARYLTDGTLDLPFGTGGIAKVSVAGNNTQGLSMVLRADGRILAGGSTGTSYLIASFNSDGTPDSSWDGDGRVTIGDAGPDTEKGFRAIALQADGRVVAVGSTNIMYRFNTDGSPDTTFDTDGSRPALATLGFPRDVVISPGGQITVVGGRAIIFPPLDYVTARYLADGSPDVSYSGDGFLDINISNSDDAWVAGADAFGKILIAGRTGLCCVQNPYEQSLFSAARISALPNAAIGISGRITGPDGFPLGRTIVSVMGAGGARTTITNPFGYYSMDNLPAGQLYTVAAHVKGLEFTPEVVFLGENLTVDLEGQMGSLGGKSRK